MEQKNEQGIDDSSWNINSCLHTTTWSEELSVTWVWTWEKWLHWMEAVGIQHLYFASSMHEKLGSLLFTDKKPDLRFTADLAEELFQVGAGHRERVFDRYAVHIVEDCRQFVGLGCLQDGKLIVWLTWQGGKFYTGLTIKMTSLFSALQPECHVMFWFCFLFYQIQCHLKHNGGDGCQ